MTEMPPHRAPCTEIDGGRLEWLGNYMHDACPSCGHPLLLHGLGPSWGERHGICHLCIGLDEIEHRLRSE